MQLTANGKYLLTPREAQALALFRAASEREQKELLTLAEKLLAIQESKAHHGGES